MEHRLEYWWKIFLGRLKDFIIIIVIKIRIIMSILAHKLSYSIKLRLCLNCHINHYCCILLDWKIDQWVHKIGYALILVHFHLIISNPYHSMINKSSACLMILFTVINKSTKTICTDWVLYRSKISVNNNSFYLWRWSK